MKLKVTKLSRRRFIIERELPHPGTRSNKWFEGRFYAFISNTHSWCPAASSASKFKSFDKAQSKIAELTLSGALEPTAFPDWTNFAGKWQFTMQDLQDGKPLHPQFKVPRFP